MKTILKTDVDFDNAMYFGWNISVWQGDELIDYGRYINYHTEHAVQINGAKYLKDVCQFKVRT